MNSPDSQHPTPRIDSDAAATRLFAGLMSSDDGASDTPPAQIDGYRLLARAGAGGQGTTWVGDRIDAEGRATMRVAVKFLRYSTRGFPRQFWSELQALHELRLDCLARVVDSGIGAGHPWIAFEYVDGDDLVEFERRASQDEVLEVIARTAEAVARIHDGGFVHRDIKPTNVVIRKSDGAPVLIDFGLACPIGSATTVGSVVGTAEFMSPEQARGEPSTPWSDQWSLAATAYLMLTGETPHRVRATSAAQFECARTQPARPAHEVLPSMRAPVAAVLDRALSRTPSQRFADCRAFASALRDAHRGVMPPRPGRPRGAMLTAFAAVPIVAAGIYLLWPTGGGARPLIAGDYPDSSFGWSIAILGDFDSDGLDEVAIGAPTAPARGHSPWFEHGGEISIVNGRDIAAFARGESPDFAPHIVSGGRVHARVGRAVSPAGDLDGDGLPEFSTVAASSGPDGEGFSGITVIRGDRRFAEPGRTDLVAHPTREIALAMRKGPACGIAAADCDKDGLSDLVCGAMHVDGERHGQLVVVHGSIGFFAEDTRSTVVESPAGLAGLGCAVATARGEGRRFVIASAPVGRTELGMRGSVAIYDADTLCTAGARPLRIVTGGRDDEWFGFALDADVRGGALALAVGAPGIARGRDDSGRGYVLSIPFGELDGREDPLDVDAPEGGKFVRSRIVGVPSGLVGSGELAAHSVALFDTSSAVGSPRATVRSVRSGAVRIARGASVETIAEGARGDEFGWAVARWKSEDSAVLLIGAPRSMHSAFARSGAVWGRVIPR